MAAALLQEVGGQEATAKAQKPQTQEATAQEATAKAKDNYGVWSYSLKS